MKSLKKLTFVLFLFAIPLAAMDTTCPDQKRGRGMGMGPGHNGPRHHYRGKRLWGNPEALKYRFNLSDTQIQKIKSINKKYHDRHLDARDKIFAIRKSLREIILAPAIDSAKLKSVLKKIALIEADIRYYKIMHRYDIEKVLTPEQRKMVREQRKRHRRYRKNRRY